MSTFINHCLSKSALLEMEINRCLRDRRSRSTTPSYLTTLWLMRVAPLWCLNEIGPELMDWWTDSNLFLMLHCTGAIMAIIRTVQNTLEKWRLTMKNRRALLAMATLNWRICDQAWLSRITPSTPQKLDKEMVLFSIQRFHHKQSDSKVLLQELLLKECKLHLQVRV